MYTLYSFPTPNGFKPTIMLEELKQPYQLKIIDIREGEQFKPKFLKISPNAKIPALEDGENKVQLFESVAILSYLAEKHRQFLPEQLNQKYKVLQWCYFQVGHIGPMFGQYGHFHRYADESIPYAKKRYKDESERLMKVMDKALKDHPYISGRAYTIADMALWPWVHCYINFYETPIPKKTFPHLMRWFEAIEKRPAVKKALAVYVMEEEAR